MTKLDNGTFRISIKALILDEQKRFMLFKEENGIWELPGGGLFFGETPQECLTRELKEEAGFEVTSIKPNPCYFTTGLNSKGEPKADLLYEVTVRNLSFTPSDECIELKFFTKKGALKLNLYTTVEEFIKKYHPKNH